MRIRTVRSDGCLSYVLAERGEALVIDPARDTAKYVRHLADLGASARFVLDTHTHADHLSGARKLADETGARLVMGGRHAEQWRQAEGKADALGIGDILRANAGVKVDLAVKDGDVLEVGGEAVRFVEAPGHTLDSLVVLESSRAFTGDTLLIGQTGRADLPGGDGGALFDTLFRRLEGLTDETIVYPGHDYQKQTVTALGFERVNNPFLKIRSRDEFLAFLKTAFPSLTGAGMQCGATTAGATASGASSGSLPADPLRDEVAGFMNAYFFGASRPGDLVSPGELAKEIESGAVPFVLDVREPAEYEQGHIAGAYNLSVHQIDGRLGEIAARRDQPVVTVCRSGKRSGWAAMFLRVAGFRAVRNLEGGMSAWGSGGLAVKRGAQP